MVISRKCGLPSFSLSPFALINAAHRWTSGRILVQCSRVGVCNCVEAKFMDFFGCEEEVKMRDWSVSVLCLPEDLRVGFAGGSRVREGGGRDGVEGMAIKCPAQEG